MKAPEGTTKAPKGGKDQLPSIMTHVTRGDNETGKDFDKPEPLQAAPSKKANKNNNKDNLDVESRRIKCSECGSEDDVINTTFRYPLNCSVCDDDSTEGRLCMRCRFFEFMKRVACEGERP